MSEKTFTQSPALFSTFVMGLASAAMIELGVVEDPHNKQKRQNTELAKQHIDYLQMLKEKTQGNLDEEESKLINSVLTDLKIHYVQAAGAARKKS
ncbi:DUF1844 domain-containing protein [bacterium]|nr:DUF1844 domain-containing protein [bacterium]